MILAFDSYYDCDKAKTVCITFKNWTDNHPENIFSQIIDVPSDYESGSFYKRELPCILKLLKSIEFKQIDFIIIDGFVLLDDQGKLGLGGHLFESLNKVIPVIGVAKSNFYGNDKNIVKLYRGESKKPLFISANGIEKEIASDLIKSMAGDFRIPTILKLLDAKTKE